MSARKLCLIPVVVVTTSASDDDIVYADREHSSHTSQAFACRSSIELVRTIDNYWLNSVTFAANRLWPDLETAPPCLITA